MIELGRILIKDETSIVESRNKIFLLAEDLNFNPIEATRLATITSELCRMVYRNGEESSMLVSFDKKGEEFGLILAFQGVKRDFDIRRVQSFFDGVNIFPIGDGSKRIEGFKYIPGPEFKPSKELIERERERLIRFSKAELLNEVKRKNEQLLKLFDDLKKAKEKIDKWNKELEMRVQERTAELAKANQALQAEITERKQAEEALRIKDNAIESSISGIAIADLKRKLTYTNNSFLKMWGYDEKEALGKHVVEFCQDEEEIAKVLEELKEKGGWIGELKAKKKDGSSFDVEISASMVKDEAGNLICMMSSFIDITDRKRAEEQIRKHIDHVTALRNIDIAITASLDLRVTLNVFLEQLTNVLCIDAASVLLFNQITLTLEYAANRGFRSNALKHTHLRLGEGHAGRTALERRIISIPNLSEAKNSFSRSPLLDGEEFIAYYATPLIAKGSVKGVLEVFNRAPLEPDQNWLDLLEALAAQAAIAIDNASLFNDLQRSNIDLVLAYDTTLEGWSKALDLRDKETEGHSQRVKDMTLKIARIMGVSETELLHVRRGALLHDIGKMGVPDSILLKPGRLTEEEWEIMRKHPVYAHELLSPITFLRPALDIPYYHHEKWDGTGYPRGLKGEQIPLSARIFALVDVWDALNSERPYRPAWPEEKVKEYLRDQTGKHFDPKVVEVFLGMEL